MHSFVRKFTVVFFFLVAIVSQIAAQTAPVIQGIDFDPRGAGASDCVSGAGFGATQSSSTVALNGSAVAVVNWSDSQVCFTIPAATPLGTANVQITTAGGQSNALSFAVVGPPSISSINAADAAPGAQVTLSGTNFGATQSVVRLWVGNSPNFNNILYLSVVSWSDTQVVATIPANAPVGAVTLEIAGNGLSTGTGNKNFSVAGPPQIQGISFDPRGAGAYDCVSGSGFGSTQGNSTVAVNGAAVPANTWSDGQVCFTIPSATVPGTTTAQVTTAAGPSNIFSFAVVIPPAITSISPSAGVPGLRVTINGSNFGDPQGQLRFLQGGSLLPMNILSWNDMQITAVIPGSGVTPGSSTVQIIANNSYANGQFTLLNPSGPLLQLSISDTPLQVNLSSPQVIDWIHWGRISATQPDHKGGVTPQISDYTPLNGGAVVASSGVAAFSWSDGDHSSLVSESLSDVQTSNTNGGFLITAPADTTVKTLNLYLEVALGTGILRASLSDGSAAAITDRSVNDLDFGSKIYSIDFKAASAGQTLTVQFLPDTNATVGLQAATLTAHLPVAAIASPSAAQQFAAPGSVPVKVSASQFDALITGITAIGSEGTVLESSGSPLNASWVPLAAGHYSLTASATDTVGLVGTSTPVELDVIGSGGNLSIQEVEPASPVDLDSRGSADWVLWGPVNGSFGNENPGHILARRPGVAPLISEYQPIGNHFIRSVGFSHDLCFNGNQQGFCSGSELAVHGIGSGFEISVAADTVPRTLQLYVATQSADGKVVAFLSDGSAPVAVEVGGSGPPLPPNTAHTTLYNIPFAAASAGQRLTVRFTMNSDQGGGQVMLIGAALNGPPVVPSVPLPQITSVTPGNAPTDARITIEGTNFGAKQRAGSVQIGDQAQVVSWSDTSIVAIVPVTLTVGRTVEVTVLTDHGLSNSAPLNILGYKIFPVAINLLVGQSRTLAAKDNNGSAVAGLPWSASDSTIVKLSADDPPVITAIAPGSTKVWAGDISVPVTVYAGTVLPAGTPTWTVPLGSGNDALNIIPAVPSDSGVDVFALKTDNFGSQSLFAVSNDGDIVWQVPVVNLLNGNAGFTRAEKIIPDFSGNPLLKSLYGFESPNTTGQGSLPALHETHKVTTIDVKTGQQADLYVYSDVHQGDYFQGGGGTSTGPFYTDHSSIQEAIPGTTGVLFVQDNGIVTVIDIAQHQQLASITLEQSTITLTNAGGSGFPPFATRDPAIGRMIVAGDGNAYLPYSFSQENGSFTGSSDPSTSGSCTNHVASNLMVLRVSPDGSNIKIPLKQQVYDFAYRCGFLTSVIDDVGFPNSRSIPSIFSLVPEPPLSVITNADQGVTVMSPASRKGNSIDVDPLMNVINQDVVAAQIKLSVDKFVPTLQREDGSYIGTTQDHQLAAVALDGTVLWQQKINPDSNGKATPVMPLYATADAGAVATSTVIDANGFPQLGMLFTVDSSGNVTGQAADTGAVASWGRQSYTGAAGALLQIEQPISLTQASFWPTAGGNPSGTAVAVAGCPCLFQTSDDSASSSAPVTGSEAQLETQPAAEALAPAPLICPICNLQPPACTTMDGTQSTFLLIVGDPGLGKHDLSNLLNLSAQQRANELQAQGHRVVACRASSVQHFANALLQNGFIDGGVIYFGHGGPHDFTSGFTQQPLGTASILAVGQDAVAGSNITAANVDQLSAVRDAYKGVVPAPNHPDRNLIGPNAAILINGCSAGQTTHDFLAGADTSIAQLIANQTRRGVYAYEDGIYFSQSDTAHDSHFDGRSVVNGKLVSRKLPNSLPMFPVPKGPPGHKPSPKPFRPQ